jgi:hypothetical protein
MRAVLHEQLSPEARIERYLSKLESVLQRKSDNPRVTTAAERFIGRLIDNAIINKNDSALVEKTACALYRSEERIAEERGAGANVAQRTFEQVKDGYIKLIHEKHSQQKVSLSRWVDYLRGNDAHYPAWFRYLAIRSVLKMGEFNRTPPGFHHRTKDTLAPFPDLNSEALGFVYKAFSEPSHNSVIQTRNMEPELVAEFRIALASKKFSSLYAVALVACNQNIDRSRIEGEWRKYDQGSDPSILESDLEGKATGWCTATGSAPCHLEHGDFYVYYTKDSNEECSVPRVAIRMEDDQISEIRGIAAGQHVESEFEEIAAEKGETLPGYKRFKKASADMKQMTAIYKKCFKKLPDSDEVEPLNPELTKEELRFLYELDSNIESFGYDRDQRIEEVLETRDQSRDYAVIFNCQRAQIVLEGEPFTLNTRVCFRDLTDRDYKILNSHPGPLVFAGKRSFNARTALTSIPEGTVFQEDVNFSKCTSLTSIKGIVFKAGVNFSECTSLTSIDDGTVFNERAIFQGCTALTSIKGIVFKEVADFSGCTSLTSIDDGTVFNEQAIFRGCTALTSISKGTVFHKDADFEGCTGLKSIDDGTVFNARAIFRGCTALKSIPNGMVFNQGADFEGCTSLKSIRKGTVFNAQAIFRGCTALTSISKGTVFHKDADFEGCTSLKSIATGTVFNARAIFRGCTALTSISKGTVFDEVADFEGCTALTFILGGEFNSYSIFKGCTSLKWIDKSASFCREIWFSGCTALTRKPTPWL